MRRVVSRLKKLYALGYKETVLVIKNKTRTAFFIYRWRKRAYSQNAAHTWQRITDKYGLNPNFSLFFLAQQQRTFVSAERFIAELQLAPQVCIEQAERVLKGYFDILGINDLRVDVHSWHTDVILQHDNPEKASLFSCASFYADIPLSIGKTEHREKDIKVPWYFSCMRHIFIVGYAYKYTGDAKYAHWFYKHIKEWRMHNPFLRGVNWMSPLEVALRASNLWWGFYFFRAAPEIAEPFWQMYTALLYDHLFYLEHTWETYDGRTNNHYISNLVGYLYVLLFFKDSSSVISKKYWCQKELLKEFDKQVFFEGTSYEGSTHYHRFVTELFYHAFLLFKDLDLSLEHRVQQKFLRMLTFVHLCFMTPDLLVSIGDNDSGKLLCFSPFNKQKVMRLREPWTEQSSLSYVKHYADFGISFMVTEQWHISIRHQAYRSFQPSGHFHHDAGSITLAFNNIPLFVDPGTFVYTASEHWRNYFRSAYAHNSFFINEVRDTQLFALDLPITQSSYKEQVSDDRVSISSKFLLDTVQNQVGYRTVSLKPKDNTVTLTDRISAQLTTDINQKVWWTFTCAPAIQLVCEKEQIGLFFGGKKIALFIATIPFEITSGWVSPAYGIKLPVQRLIAPMSLETAVHNRIKIMVRII